MISHRHEMVEVTKYSEQILDGVSALK